MAQTSNFGFDLIPEGDMVFGRDLNRVLEDLDDKLGQSLGAMSESASVAGAAVGTATWTAVVGLAEIIFGSQIKLSRVRFVTANGTMAANVANLALARAGTIIPLTGSLSITGVGGEGIVYPLAETIIDADEELIVIEKDDVDVGFVAVADVQVVVEGNRVTT